MTDINEYEQDIEVLIAKYSQDIIVATASKNKSQLDKIAMKNDPELLEALKSNKAFNPARKQNHLIRKSRARGDYNLVSFLWSFQEVKDTLKNDNQNLYDFLVTQDIKNKLEKF